VLLQMGLESIDIEYRVSDYKFHKSIGVSILNTCIEVTEYRISNTEKSIECPALLKGYLSLLCEFSCVPSVHLISRITYYRYTLYTKKVSLPGYQISGIPYYTVCTRRVCLLCGISCAPSVHLSSRMTYYRYTLYTKKVSLLCEFSCATSGYQISGIPYYTVCTRRVCLLCGISCAPSVHLSSRMTYYTLCTHTVGFLYCMSSYVHLQLT
jgi:hypothetical protein